MSPSKSKNASTLIDVVLKKTGLKQMDIAKKLGVSRAQISKWKSGEDIPDDRRTVLNEMAGLFGDDTEWALLTKTPENAESWIKFFEDRHENCLDVDPCEIFADESEFRVPEMLLMFNSIGIKIPEKAPDIDSDEDYEGTDFDSLITNYLESFSALTRWYEINISSINNDEVFEDTLDLAHYITEYALKYVDQDILTKLGADLSIVAKTVTETKKEMTDTIEDIIDTMLNSNAPIMTDYFDLINKAPYVLDDEQMMSSIARGSSIESRLPLFERTVLNQNVLLLELLTELHVKIDTLIKPEDKEKLSRVLEHTPPLNNKHLVKDDQV
jgi:transcriptional regulator with XRE-family HTH domain